HPAVLPSEVVKVTMTTYSRWIVCTVALSIGLIAAHASGQISQPNSLGQIRHAAGQNVVPVFEGWEKNPDGSFNMVFGYMNRNYEEEVDVPVGSDNRIEPGPADQGQPTHFYPRRSRFLFRVRVPQDFGTREVVWSLI